MSTTPLQLDRRAVLRGALALTGAALCGGMACAEDAPRGPLPPWRVGEFDLHHIDTGRGNCTLLIAPDGTTIMIDAGAGDVPPSTSSEAHPNATRRAGEWQARYALAYSPKPSLDYFVTTHLHPDHIGDAPGYKPAAPYIHSGVSDVDALMPIHTLIDRAYPDYASAPRPDAPFAASYVAYLQSRTAAHKSVERAQVGSDRQILLTQKPDRFPMFSARILAANGQVWNRSAQPAAADAHQSENNYSVALRFQYGRFSYFTGGDLNADTHDGRDPALDLESPVARAAGRTEVATANHHGYFDACGPAFVQALDAQVYIVQAWDIGHPGIAQMQRMLGAWDGKAKHDVFTTDLLPANELNSRRFSPLLKSKHGHVVVRVAPGGDSYRIYTLDSSREAGEITGIFGPYQCRA